MNIDDQATKIQKNFNTFRKFCGQLGDRSDQFLEFVDFYGERLALCPASSRVQYHNSFPGGLIDHSVRVLSNAMKLSSAMGYKFPKESLIIAALFHDIGKLGTRDEERYLEQDSNWHRDQGIAYKINPKIVMPVRDCSMYVLQDHGIRLLKDEYLAILLNDGPSLDANRSYTLKEPKLALLVQQADMWAAKEEQGRTGL